MRKYLILMIGGVSGVVQQLEPLLLGSFVFELFNFLFKVGILDAHMPRVFV